MAEPLVAESAAEVPCPRLVLEEEGDAPRLLLHAAEHQKAVSAIYLVAVADHDGETFS